MSLTVSYKRDAFLLDNLRALVTDWYEDATGDEAMPSQVETLVRNIADEINDYKQGHRVKYRQNARDAFSIGEWIQRLGG